MTHVKGSSPSTHSPTPGVTSADALSAAQATADAVAQRFVDSGDATYDERAALVQDLRIAVAQVDAIERAQR